ncbi:hypothetical protein [Aquipuribacter sp. SD81]|uniref:hypothetical protein n=1 Tax=Aquipuribacter sp. SD81 TaxID=3127703 RepID=UPI0030185F7E
MKTTTDMSTGPAARTRYTTVNSRVHAATSPLRATGGVCLQSDRLIVSDRAVADRFVGGGIATGGLAPTFAPSGPPTD